MKKNDYIIVGCGFFGAAAAECLRRRGKSVLVIEKRDHIGGNCYSYEYEGTHINVHKYGTHIFHTNSKKVWEYVNRFGEFNNYQHRVLTTHQGKVYSMPINLGTVNSFYNKNLTPPEAADLIAKGRGRIAHPKNLEEKAINLVGKKLYEAFFKGYTKKQWG